MLTKLAIVASTPPAGLDSVTKALLQDAFDSVKASGIEVVGMGIIAAVAVIVVAAGSKFALKQIKGLLSKAS